MGAIHAAPAARFRGHGPLFVAGMARSYVAGARSVPRPLVRVAQAGHAKPLTVLQPQRGQLPAP